jgi:hypothetical protein
MALADPLVFSNHSDHVHTVHEGEYRVAWLAQRGGFALGSLLPQHAGVGFSAAAPPRAVFWCGNAVHCFEFFFPLSDVYHTVFSKYHLDRTTRRGEQEEDAIMATQRKLVTGHLPPWPPTL